MSAYGSQLAGFVARFDRDRFQAGGHPHTRLSPSFERSRSPSGGWEKSCSFRNAGQLLYFRSHSGERIDAVAIPNMPRGVARYPVTYFLRYAVLPCKGLETMPESMKRVATW
jgi:hypothetical protein